MTSHCVMHDIMGILLMLLWFLCFRTSWRHLIGCLQRRDQRDWLRGELRGRRRGVIKLYKLEKRGNSENVTRLFGKVTQQQVLLIWVQCQAVLIHAWSIYHSLAKLWNHRNGFLSICWQKCHCLGDDQQNRHVGCASNEIMYLALNVTDTTQQSEGVVQIIYTEPREMMYQNKHEQACSPVHEVRFKHPKHVQPLPSLSFRKIPNVHLYQFNYC